MKKIVFLTVVFFGIGKLSFAQQDTTIVYADEDYNVTTKIKTATYKFCSYQKDSITWTINTYDKLNNLIKTDNYADATLLFAHGQSVEYYKGKPILKGMYKKGNKNGAWITYDTLGNVIKITTYLNDRLNGSYKEFLSNGNLKEKGNYDWNVKKGEWKFYHDNGKIASNEFFEGFDNIATKASYFDVNGVATTKELTRTEAVFPLGSINTYLYREIASNHPSFLTIVGKVVCLFVIDKFGKVQSVKVLTQHGNFTKEAKKAILNSPKWKPATMFGQNVDSTYTVTLTFVR